MVCLIGFSPACCFFWEDAGNSCLSQLNPASHTCLQPIPVGRDCCCLRSKGQRGSCVRGQKSSSLWWVMAALTQPQHSPSAYALAARKGWLWLGGDGWLLAQEVACSFKPRAFPCRCQVETAVIEHLDSEQSGCALGVS